MEKEEVAIQKKVSILEGENEVLDQELTKEQKKAAIAEARKTYGRDWKSVVWGAIKSVKINKENLQTLHSMGVDTSLKDMNDPRKWKE